MKNRAAVPAVLVLVLSALLLPAVFLSAGCGGAGRRPRGVVLVVVDAMRREHLGCYGYGKDTTPHVDALAREGAVFEEAITQASFSGPSYATILTGKLPRNHGVRDHPRVLDARNVTIAEQLAASGVRTAGFVAHSFLARRWHYDQGFQVYERVPPATGGAGHTARAGKVIDRALAWLRKLPDDAPFFLFVQVQEPHQPYDPPAPWNSRFGNVPPGFSLKRTRDGRKVRRAELMFSFRELGFTDADRDAMIALYDGEVAYADHELARLVDALRAAGRLDDTLFAVTADHGESLGEHDLYFGHDMSLYDEVARVPLVVRAPAAVPAGTRVAAQVRLMDLAPTFADWLGTPPLPDADGASLLPVVRGEEKAVRVAFTENEPFKPERKGYPHYRVYVPGVAGKWRSVRTPDGKLIRIPRPDGIEWELYDLREDPGETRNLWGTGHPLERPLRNLLEQELSRDPDLGSTGEEELDPEAIEELRSLGYLG